VLFLCKKCCCTKDNGDKDCFFHIICFLILSRLITQVQKVLLTPLKLRRNFDPKSDSLSIKTKQFHQPILANLVFLFFLMKLLILKCLLMFSLKHCLDNLKSRFSNSTNIAVD